MAGKPTVEAATVINRVLSFDPNSGSHLHRKRREKSGQSEACCNLFRVFAVYLEAFDSRWLSGILLPLTCILSGNVHGTSDCPTPEALLTCRSYAFKKNAH